MRNNRSAAGGSNGRSNRRPPRRRNAVASGSRAQSQRTRRPAAKPTFKVVDRGTEAVDTAAEEAKSASEAAFRILIAVHRPRYRGRADRAAALAGWEITSLLNKQDVVGQVAKPPRPPDILVLSGDFGRQRDYAIFRAVQSWRSQGMTLIGMVEDCRTAPEAYPESVPEQLCDVCLTPPYKTADLRALFIRLYEEKRGRPAPPPRSAMPEAEDDQEES
jgi:hypothetical protein